MGRKQKITIVVEESLVTGMRDAVATGVARSQSGLVQDAVMAYLDSAQRESRARAYADAARDRRFLADVEQVRQDFEHADAEIE